MSDDCMCYPAPHPRATACAEHGHKTAEEIASDHNASAEVRAVEQLREALRAVERTLLQSPLVKPYKREAEALVIVRAALATAAGTVPAASPRPRAGWRI